MSKHSSRVRPVVIDTDMVSERDIDIELEAFEAELLLEVERINRERLAA